MPSTLIWLDATDSDVQGTFRWAATNELLTYANWDSVSPSVANAENCVMLNAANAEWSDFGCFNYANSVCELEY